jgi:hypothetical protein
MMGRLVGALATLLVCFCAATLLAEAAILSYVWSAWKLDQAKLVHLVAVARGSEPEKAEPKALSPEKGGSEQASYQEILDRRALKLRDFELREQALNSALDELKSQQQELDKSRKQEQSQIAQFDSQLKTLRDGAQATGRETVRRTLETLKPKQAKEQVFQMLQNNEIDEVVLLLSQMPENRRAKVLAEFKTPEENKQLAEVLRRIREGEPESGLVKKAKQPPATGNSVGP